MDEALDFESSSKSSATESSTPTSSSSSSNSTKLFVAQFDYTSQGQKNSLGEKDLSFKKGEIMSLIDRRTNWLLVELNSEIGLVPSNYVQPFSESIKEIQSSPSLQTLPTNETTQNNSDDQTPHNIPTSQAQLLSHQTKSDLFRNSSFNSTNKINIREGFLTKRGEIYKSWKLRWFVLKPDALYYYEQPPDNNIKNWTPIKVIPLSLVIAVGPISDREKEGYKLSKNMKPFFLFKVMTISRDFILAASSSNEREDWILNIKSALQLERK